MPKPKGDGGPAFPTENERQTGNSSYHYQGMSLRDYFAAKAMQGMLVDKEIEGSWTRCAAWSYQMADAMLKAREVSDA